MEKSYYFDNEEYTNKLEEIYSIHSKRNILYSSLTKDNLNTLMQTLLKTLENPKTKTYEIPTLKQEKITCLEKQPKEEFEKLFNNKDLILYGHGGCAKEIMQSGEFRCRFNNIGSHFEPLSKTNESLQKLNNWPHRGHTEIAIMALNKREYNPIYKTREKKEEYDTDIHSISTEYFAGYYDATEKKFVPNPTFKVNHEYNPLCTGYIDEEFYSNILIDSKDENVCDFINLLQRISLVMIRSSNTNLSPHGLEGVKEQLLNYMKKAYELQDILTPEYLEDLEKREIEEINKRIKESELENSEWDVEFPIDSFWDDEPEQNINKK